MSKYAVYIYPNISRDLMGSNNPYIDHLKTALDENGLGIPQATSDNAFLDFIRNGLSSDMVILNWLENLPSRRMGLLQTFILLTYIPVLKIRGTKIIWIKHNKVSHIKKYFAISKMIQKALTRYADHIVIHAKDAGVTDPGKTIYLPHPSNIEPDLILSPAQDAPPAIDLLIWGSLLPYKGVLEFLQYARQEETMQQLSIHIVGKCAPDYWDSLQQYATPNIKMLNGYIEEEELRALFGKSRFILFTYKTQSVISSGVLIDSLAACRKIIAPDCGAFSDMSRQQNFVQVYKDFPEISTIFREHYNDYKLNYEEVCAFVTQNSWYNMGAKIKTLTQLEKNNKIKSSVL